MLHDPKTTPDMTLIRPEVDELLELEGQVADRKRQIVLRAAEKLCEKYADDTSVVAGRLAHIIARDREVSPGKWEYALVGKSWLYAVLPEQCKQRRGSGLGAVMEGSEEVQINTGGNTDAVPNTAAEAAIGNSIARREERDEKRLQRDLRGEPVPLPNTGIVRFVQSLRDTAVETATLCAMLERELKTVYREEGASGLEALGADDGAAVLEGHESYLEKFSGTGNFQSVLPLLEDVRRTAAAARGLLDRRQRFSLAARLGLQVAFVTHSYSEMASKVSGRRYGGKWMAKIDGDEETRRFAEVFRCPGCGLDAQLYVEKAKWAIDNGEPLPDIAEFCGEHRARTAAKK